MVEAKRKYLDDPSFPPAFNQARSSLEAVGTLLFLNPRFLASQVYMAQPFLLGRFALSALPCEMECEGSG